MLLISVVLVVVVIILVGHIAHLNKEALISSQYRPLQGYRYSEDPTDNAVRLIKNHPYASGATQYLILSYDQIWQLQSELRLAELNSIILRGLSVYTGEVGKIISIGKETDDSVSC